jgi:hypothetical protein
MSSDTLRPRCDSCAKFLWLADCFILVGRNRSSNGWTRQKERWLRPLRARQRGCHKRSAEQPRHRPERGPAIQIILLCWTRPHQDTIPMWPLRVRVARFSAHGGWTRTTGPRSIRPPTNRRARIRTQPALPGPRLPLRKPLGRFASTRLAPPFRTLKS